MNSQLPKAVFHLHKVHKTLDQNTCRRTVFVSVELQKCLFYVKLKLDTLMRHKFINNLPITYA